MIGTSPKGLLQVVAFKISQRGQLLYKAVLSVIASGIYIGWIIADYPLNQHKYFTVLGMLGSAIVRLCCLFQAMIPRIPFTREILSVAQVYTASYSIVILVFYWTVLAYFDYHKPKTAVDHAFNILMHIVSPACAILPVLIEQNLYMHFLALGIFLCSLAYVIFLVYFALRFNEGVYHPLFTFRDVFSYIATAFGLALAVAAYYFFWWVSKVIISRVSKKASNSPVRPSEQAACETQGQASTVNIVG